MTRRLHLAQANIAQMRAPMDEPLMESFMTRLEPLNALADSAPGFVWRLQREEGDATSVRALDDETILCNLSAWESIEALKAYVHQSNHVVALQKRAERFERPGKSSLVLWWIDAGHIPTEEEAGQRFELLWDNGPTPEAFTLHNRFDRKNTDG